jgi:hypothetical protein
MLLRLLPGQNLIDLPKNDEGMPAVEFGRHHGPSVNSQVRPANQDCLLPAFGLDSMQLDRDDRGRVPELLRTLIWLEWIAIRESSTRHSSSILHADGDPYNVPRPGQMWVRGYVIVALGVWNHSDMI